MFIFLAVLRSCKNLRALIMLHSHEREICRSFSCLLTTWRCRQMSFMMQNFMTPYFDQLQVGVSKALKSGLVTLS